MKDVWNLMERLLKLLLFSCPRFFFSLLAGSSCDRALFQCPRKDSTEKIISSLVILRLVAAFPFPLLEAVCSNTTTVKIWIH